jgi:hypothetical protein
MRILHVGAGALAVLALSAAPAHAQGRWRVAYPEAKNPEYAALQQHFSEQDILASMVEPLNEHFPVSRDVTIELAECGREGAFYDAERPAVQLCYELLVNLAQSLMGDQENGEQVFVGAFAYILLHQVGHALMDQMDLPVRVPPEEAADQLTAVMAAFAPEELQTIAEGALVLGERGVDWENPGSGRAALSGARMQNLLCLFYGIDSEGYAWMVDEGHLPAARAEGCTDEIETVKEEWVEYLAPHAQG